MALTGRVTTYGLSVIILLSSDMEGLIGLNTFKAYAALVIVIKLLQTSLGNLNGNYKIPVFLLPMHAKLQETQASHAVYRQSSSCPAWTPCKTVYRTQWGLLIPDIFHPWR